MKERRSMGDAIRQYVEGKGYRPMSAGALFRKLHIPKKRQKEAEKVLDKLVQEGVLKRVKNRFVCAKRERPVVQGVIRMHPRGFGFVAPSDATTLTKDIFIPRMATMNAVDGDIVEVEITGPGRDDKGPEGELISIIKRGRKTLGGIIVEHKKGDEYCAYAPLLGPDKEVVVLGKKLQVGERWILEVIEWEEGDAPMRCKAQEKIGHIEDATVDIDAAVKEYEIASTFGKKAIAEAKTYGKTVGDPGDRADFRDTETFTIDPIDAKDFDDALSLTVHKNGDMTLLVHIADVSHYVKVGSALDDEAHHRCNSTYFPGRCVPMLPEELSNELCSLKPKVDRFAITVEMIFDKEGNLKDYGIDRSIIHSQTRFTYEEAKLVLDGKKKSRHSKTLKKMVDLCLLLKEKRSERGSVDLAMPEVRLVMGKDGIPTGYEIVEYDITHQLVEEFMLKANEIVAHQLIEMDAGAIFRVHEEPAEKDLTDFYAVARRLGYTLTNDPTQEDICDLFQKAKGSAHLQQLSIAFIRSMKLAIYSERNVGHYGLGLEHYCHFTSPIRRYSDLIIHRLLFEEETGDLAEVALRCSEKERMSFRAEQSVRNLKKLRYLGRLYDNDPNAVYDVEVSKIKPFGLFFVLPPLGIEGFVHISAIGSDYYDFDPRSETLKGRRTGQTFRPGDKIRARVEEIDLIYQESTWQIEN